MSGVKQTIAKLADDACAMPWEDKAPFFARYAFKEAITPELFVELLQALVDLYAVASTDDRNYAAVTNAAAVIAKATGASQ